MVNKHYLLKQGRPSRSDRELPPPPPLHRKIIFIKNCSMGGHFAVFSLVGGFFPCGGFFLLVEIFLLSLCFFFYFFLPMGALSSMWESFLLLFSSYGEAFFSICLHVGVFSIFMGGGSTLGLSSSPHLQKFLQEQMF